MRKLILFFTVIAFGLTMTSCLNTGSQNFAETSVVYIAMDNGVVYGRTLRGKIITSDKIRMMEPGTFKLFNYSWEESYGYTTLGEVNIFNVVIAGEVLDINKTHLNMMPVTEAEPIVYFDALKNPIYNQEGVYFDDFWLFEYNFKAKKGESTLVTFNKRAPGENADVIEVDVRLKKLGTPDSGASDVESVNIVAVDMKQLRQMHEGTSTTSTKDIQVKFYYYLEGREGLVDTQTFIMKVKGN